MNEGERGELKFIATLSTLIGKSINLSSNQLNIDSVHIPCSSGLRSIAPNNTVSVQQISQMNEYQLEAFCFKAGITKAGRMSKADVFINNIGYSIKYTDSAPPAIVNHTNRTGWEFAANQKGLSIQQLDFLIDDYWSKRLTGIITEDVVNTHPKSPFANHQPLLEPFLEYFSFEGTGSQKSNHPASAVIEFSNPCDISKWILINKKQFINNVWDRLVFSLRSSKGMPTDINSRRLNAYQRSSILKWSRNVDGALKGALHVRIK